MYRSEAKMMHLAKNISLGVKYCIWRKLMLCPRMYRRRGKNDAFDKKILVRGKLMRLAKDIGLRVKIVHWRNIYKSGGKIMHWRKI